MKASESSLQDSPEERGDGRETKSGSRTDKGKKRLISSGGRPEEDAESKKQLHERVMRKVIRTLANRATKELSSQQKRESASGRLVRVNADCRKAKGGRGSAPQSPPRK